MCRADVEVQANALTLNTVGPAGVNEQAFANTRRPPTGGPRSASQGTRPAPPST
ncbi:hypothetical protein BURMUCGD2M_5090 [Burkholderia multivorans CGD2M]|uniref:Uncharacterized protein n=1 Tax=Burkholderia multivorans CGD2 TaxID=513052 RepID=B9BJ41_9BURK|nr:hypothetical protein BURMUCGD2_5097 [Burkholderia multivorans CGD2]EEE15647.1 hypothetical protein BURMUCGD2M_5090 [Burkholderia multivorans CGD2M]